VDNQISAISLIQRSNFDRIGIAIDMAKAKDCFACCQMLLFLSLLFLLSSNVVVFGHLVLLSSNVVVFIIDVAWSLDPALPVVP